MGVNCGDRNPTDFVCTPGAQVPWCAPGTAPVQSACGIFSGGWRSRGRDMRDLPPGPRETWQAGGVADVAVAITANHGGGWAFRLARADADGGALSETSFQAGHLAFAGDTQRIVDAAGRVVATIPAVRTAAGTWPAGSTWTRNPFPMERGTITPIPSLPNVYGRGPFNYSVVDSVAVPANLAPGRYVLSWRWDAEQTKQVWAHCSDVLVVAPGTSADSAAVAEAAAVAAAAVTTTLPSGRKHVCTGDSLGLDVGDCDVWVEIYDAMGGPQWPATWGQGCDDVRLNPCGCNGFWQKFVQCTAKRDYLRITEIYMLGDVVVGTIPAAIAELDAVVALSLVGTRLHGSLPPQLGKMASLEMLWLDHNPDLSGPIPASFEALSPKLTAFELHRSNFTGRLPKLNWATIADCTLNDLVFDCPLPEGAETCGAACR
eukprot:g2778.t1